MGRLANFIWCQVWFWRLFVKFFDIERRKYPLIWWYLIDTDVYSEYLRLSRLPQNGYYTLLHHRGPFIERSTNLMERVMYILKDKDEEEVLTRLRNIHYMTTKMQDEATPIIREAHPTANASIIPSGRAYMNDKLCERLKYHMSFCSWNSENGAIFEYE